MRSSCELHTQHSPPPPARRVRPRARARDRETARAPEADPHRDEKAEGDNNVKHTPGDRILWLE